MRFDFRIVDFYSVDQLQAFLEQEQHRLIALTTLLIHKDSVDVMKLDAIAENVGILKNEIAQRSIET